MPARSFKNIKSLCYIESLRVNFMFILFISADFEELRRKWPWSKDVRQTLLTLQMLYVLKTLTHAFFCLVQSKVEYHVYWTFPAKSSPKALKNMV